jgi:CDP-ribitol ribitolphosphotransferase
MGIEWEGDELALRVNPMQGADEKPLRPGRWDVVVVEPAGRVRPVEVAEPGPLAAAAASARFDLGRRGTYVVALVAGGTPARAGLWFEVRVEPGSEWFGVVGEDGEPVLPQASSRLPRPIRRLLVATRARGFQLMFNLFRLAAFRNGRRILFTSDSRSDLGGNLGLVYRRMVERGLDRRYDLMTLFKPGIRAARSWRDRFRMPWLLARADVVVLDDYQPAIYRVQDRNVKIIQLWHAYGSFKTVGYSRVGKPGGPDPWSRVHRNYTYATVGSHNDVAHYAEAFGIPERRVVPIGVPRMDEFVLSSRDPAGRDRAYEAVPEAAGRRTVLFAPTFRGSGAKSATYDLSRLDLAAIHALCVDRDAVFVIRLHPFVAERAEIPDELRDRVVDATDRPVETNDLLLITDLLVTDYSSIVFEFATLRRPMLFFAYDLDDYVATRDFYVPYEEWVPGRIVRTFPELLDAIRRDDYGADKVDAFVERNFDHLEGGSADRIIDRLILAG